MLVPLTALLVLTHEAKPEPAEADDRTPSRQLEGRAAMWSVAAAALSLAVLNGAHRLARSGSRPTAQNHCLVVRRG